MNRRLHHFWSRLPAESVTILVLLGLGAFFSATTLREQSPEGSAGARQLADQIAPVSRVLIVAQKSDSDVRFADTLQARLSELGVPVAGVVIGEPADARRELQRLRELGQFPDLVACSSSAASWGVFDRFEVEVIAPQGRMWPDFLKTDNLLNVLNQIAVIAVIAVGMTLVIITGGIDLSVGSLIALSAVVTARLIRDLAGAETATPIGMIICGMAGVVTCLIAGVFSGCMVALCRVPPFIATLAMMLVASGAAWIAADGQSINAVPDGLRWLDHGTFLGVPNPLILMLGLYLGAAVVMSRTILGRYVYAVGGNAEAARLSGVPVKRVLIFVYGLCGLLAGVAGLIMASRFTSGDPKYGQMYELTVIAAVVVGGTSLSGGEGRVTGTLIGALIIAVIQNGMNLLSIESYTQKVVLGSVILGAVLIDRLKRRG